MRKRLKAEWPGVKFSVKTEHGQAVNVRWTDGPRSSVVDALLGDLKGGYFDDGVEDSFPTSWSGRGPWDEDAPWVCYDVELEDV